MNVEDFSILHISDIHKADNCDYDGLFDSLVANNNSYTSEGIPPIRFIVVSGDLVKGSSSKDLNDANIEIDSQYAEVEEFLRKLVEKFLDNDKRRMIIVPGNHDINRCISKNSMSKVQGENIKDAKRAYLSHPQMYNSEYKWSWDDLQFYKITDTTLYKTRFDNFVKFYDRFFSCVGRSYPKERELEAYIDRFEDYNVAFACYNSNCGIDHLNPMGLIHEKANHSIFAEVDRAHNDGMLVIGVWHHHVYGYPYSNNYLDRDIVRILCNHHIRVGLFGHQHKSEIAEELRDLSSDKDDKMLLVCSGTLFGDKESVLA